MDQHVRYALGSSRAAFARHDGRHTAVAAAAAHQGHQGHPDDRMVNAHLRRNPPSSGYRANAKKTFNSAKRTLLATYKDTDN